jgi:hypothetical protein
MADSTESIIYGEAVRMISEQRGVRDGLRTRAGTLLTAASLVTSFLGSVALSRYHDTHPHKGLAWSGVAAFIGVVVLAVLILVPWWRWTFVMNPKILVEDHLLGPERTEPDRLRQFLAESYNAYFDQNAKTLDWMFRFFVIACALLIYEAVVWVLVLERG